jgi:ATP-dependent RNA helicase DeaD
MKPGAKPKAKAKAKAVWKQDSPAATEPARPPKGKPPAGKKPYAGKPKTGKGKPAPKAAGSENSYKRAADPSKRFTPPNKIGKQGGAKGKAGKGGNATPRRSK